MLIFGGKTKTKVTGQEILTCPCCGREAAHTFSESQRWFTLYFIAVCPVGPVMRVAQCNLCGAITHGSEEDLVIEPGEPSTTQCPICSTWVKVGALVCSSCGHTFTRDEIRRAEEEAKARETSDADAIWKRLQR